MVVNLIGLASWLGGRFCMQLGPGRYSGGHHQWPRWASGHFAYFLYSKRDSQFFGEILWYTIQWVDANSSTSIAVNFLPNQLGERLLWLACPTDRYVLRQPLIEFFVHIQRNTDQYFVRWSSNQQPSLWGNRGVYVLPHRESLSVLSVLAASDIVLTFWQEGR